MLAIFAILLGAATLPSTIAQVTVVGYVGQECNGEEEYGVQATTDCTNLADDGYVPDNAESLLVSGTAPSSGDKLLIYSAAGCMSGDYIAAVNIDNSNPECYLFNPDTAPDGVQSFLVGTPPS